MNLMSMGLMAQQMIVDANAGGYTRIVQGSEALHTVFLEALEHGCFVMTDGKRTMIGPRILPGFVKVDSETMSELRKEENGKI